MPKFDEKAIKNFKSELNEIMYMVNELIYTIGTENLEKGDLQLLLETYEDVLRVALMYNHLVEEIIESNEIHVKEPQKYIKYNLDNACLITQKIYRKYK